MVTEHELICLIHDELSKHPDWLRSVLDATNSGMQAALATANNDRAAYDLAFRSALSLADPKRISKETRKILNDAIVMVIPNNGACRVELDALKMISREQQS